MEPESSFTGNRHWLYFELDECGRNMQTLFLSFILIFSYLLLELQSDILWLGYNVFTSDWQNSFLLRITYASLTKFRRYIELYQGRRIQSDE